MIKYNIIISNLNKKNLIIKKEFENTFINHINVLNKRINKKKYLDVEILESMIQELGEKFLQISREILDIDKYENINHEVEYFLVATHIKLSNGG